VLNNEYSFLVAVAYIHPVKNERKKQRKRRGDKKGTQEEVRITDKARLLFCVAY
jgi:hypothetical protein